MASQKYSFALRAYGQFHPGLSTGAKGDTYSAVFALLVGQNVHLSCLVGDPRALAYAGAPVHRQLPLVLCEEATFGLVNDYCCALVGWPSDLLV